MKSAPITAKILVGPWKPIDQYIAERRQAEAKILVGPVRPTAELVAELRAKEAAKLR